MTGIWWISVSIEIFLCSLTATTAHLVMSLGQTLFHRYFGHRGIGGRFFYLFLPLDLFIVQLTAMSVSFYVHLYFDKQYHVAGSWLGRFCLVQAKATAPFSPPPGCRLQFCGSRQFLGSASRHL